MSVEITDGNTPKLGADSLSADEKIAVREQLERILASLFFRSSKRYCDFFRYTVEHALDDDTEGIKERTLGIEVFGREPDYDTSQDPVVRVTASEVRKRLAQYYQAPGHEHETRLDFPRRSYVPEFRFSKERAIPTASDSLSVPAGLRSWRGQSVVLILVSCTFLSVFFWRKLPGHETTLDQFWSPVVSSSFPALLCVPDIVVPSAPGEPALASAAAKVSVSADPLPKPPPIAFGNALALSKLTGVLGNKGKRFIVRRTDDAELEDLQEGPVVLIGWKNNRWTNQFSEGLRFNFVRDGDQLYISDRQNLSDRKWSITDSSTQFGQSRGEGYALISRVRNSTTGHFVIMVAGITQFGTEAAATCLTSSTCLQDAANVAPGDWSNKNLQIVVGTTVIGEYPGQPRVLAAYLW